MRYLAIVSWTLLFISTAFAEGVMVGRDGVKLNGFGNVDLDKTIAHWAENERQILGSELDLRIELLTNVCELKDREVNKLRLAAKAVVRRRMSSGKEQLTQFIYESGLVAPDEELNHVDYEDKLVPFRAKSLDNGLVHISTRFEQPLDQRPMWTKVLKNSLSESQWSKYQKHRITRNTGILKAAVSAGISDLDDSIFLTQADRSNLINSIVTDLSKTVTLDRPSNMKQANEIARSYIKQIENLKPHLRASQYARLEQLANEVKGGVSWSVR